VDSGKTRVLGLHDGTLEGYTRSGTSLLLSIRKWDETHVEVAVRDVVYVRQQMGDCDLEGFFEVSPSSMLEQAIQHLKILGWSEKEVSPLKHFQLLDSSAIPVLDIVGQRWGVATKDELPPPPSDS
jgi:hypothetical protein